MSIRSGLRIRYTRQVVVHTVDGRSIRGVLVHHYRDALVLQHAALLMDENSEQTLVGEVIVPREHVSFVQVP